MFFIYLVIIIFSNVLGSNSYVCITSKNINCIKYNVYNNNKLILYDYAKICDNYKEKIFLYKELDYLEFKYNKWLLVII